MRFEFRSLNLSLQRKVIPTRQSIGLSDSLSPKPETRHLCWLQWKKIYTGILNKQQTYVLLSPVWIWYHLKFSTADSCTSKSKRDTLASKEWTIKCLNVNVYHCIGYINKCRVHINCTQKVTIFLGNQHHAGAVAGPLTHFGNHYWSRWFDPFFCHIWNS